MRLIIKGKGHGKTEELMRLSAENWHHMVVRDQAEVDRIWGLARDKDIDIPQPITFDQFMGGHYGTGIKGFLIDNADFLLRAITGPPIMAISMTDDGRPDKAPPRSADDKVGMLTAALVAARRVGYEAGYAMAQLHARKKGGR